MKKRLSAIMRMSAVVFMAAAMAVSCQKSDPETPNPDPEPNPDPDTTETVLEDLKQNTIVINGEEKAVAKVFVDEYSGYMMVTATDNAEAESFDWLVDNNGEYVQVLVIPSLYNVEFDAKTETAAFTIISTYEAAPLFEGAGAGATDAIESAKCRFDFDGENAELFLDMKLADGNTVAARCTGTYAGEKPQENVIAINGETKVLRASFYSVEDGLGYFYFTPGDIDYFEEIEMATYYVAIMMDESLLENGTTVDVNTTTEYFDIFLVDNITGDMLEVSTDSHDGAEGTFSISRLQGEASFKASMSLKFNADTQVELSFEGECTDMYAAPEEPNEITYDGTSTAIASVVVDMTSDMRTIWLSTTAGIETVAAMQNADPLKITAPAEAFTGEPVGFSTYKSIIFEYKGSTWNYDNGSLGTLTVSLEGTTLNLDITNYVGLKAHYSGEAVVIE